MAITINSKFVKFNYVKYRTVEGKERPQPYVREDIAEILDAIVNYGSIAFIYGYDNTLPWPDGNATEYMPDDPQILGGNVIFAQGKWFGTSKASLEDALGDSNIIEKLKTELNISTLESTVSKKVDKTDITQSTGTSETAVMSQKAISDALGKKADLTNSKQTIRAGVTWTDDIYLGDETHKISFNNNGDLTYNDDKVMVGSTVSNEVSLVQNTGQSTTSVMSQKAVSDKMSELEDIITDTKEEIAQIPVQMHTDGVTNGYWWNVNGTWLSDNTRRSTEKIDVAEGEKYLVSTSIGGSTVIAYLAQWNGDTWVGVSDAFKGGSGNAVDREYIVPSGVTKIAICSYDSSLPSLKKITSLREFKSYTKVESDEKYAPISVQGIKRYGVKWSIADADDLGVRCFDAVGLSAEIAIGSTEGHSDFDNIYPWSEIKRCNILVNANGAKVVTFEGETGFTLDGSNGDVFVRIPKFSVEKYVKNGEEYRVISNDMNHIHPAFIEDGKVLDEIFISAFEASENGGKLYSKGGVIPANNITAQEFLNYAKAKGIGYSLFDNRCVDLLFCLMSVEYGCRNSNRILGYGYSGYIQAAQYQTWLHCTVSSPSTNTITLGKPIDNTVRLSVLAALAPGQNICICGNAQDGRQYNIIAQRKITSISCPTTNDNFVVSFDGEPIAVDAEVAGSTNYTYVGNAPSNCNTCETITDNGAAMTYHTGRTQRALSPIGEVQHETANVCRYRWIENPVGNVWHFLPDVTFVNGQMYVCENMRDYVCHKYTSPYKPVGAVLQAQESNGHKSDIVNANFWITSLVSDIFAKGNVFGNAFDKSLVSTKAFGAYYYLSSGSIPRIISHGGGFDHLYRCNILTQRAWQDAENRWYLYGARLMFKDID